MELRRLNAKKVRVGAKNGMTMEDFCGKYDCSVEQFSNRITQLYGGDLKAVSRIIDQIEGNSKKPRPHLVNNDDLDEADDLASVDTSDKLGYLRESENNLVSEISVLESRHESLLSRHDDYMGQLAELETGYERIREELIAKGRKFDKLAGLINESAEAINSLVLEWRCKALELAQVREELAVLEQVKLVVSGTGVISAPGNAEFSFNETGSEEWYRELLQDEDTIGNLRLRDVRVLARLLAILENAAVDGYSEVTVEFEENPELEVAYAALR